MTLGAGVNFLSYNLNNLCVTEVIQYNNGIYRALFTKRPGALTQLAVICSEK